MLCSLYKLRAAAHTAAAGLDGAGAALLLQEWVLKLVAEALAEAGVTAEEVDVIAYTKVGGQLEVCSRGRERGTAMPPTPRAVPPPLHVHCSC